MKKVFLGMAALAFLFASCEQDPDQTISNEQQEAQVDMSDFYLYTNPSDDKRSDNAAEKCYSMKNLNRLLNENKGLHEKMYNIEKNTRSILAKSENAKGGKPGTGGGGTEPPATDNLGIVNIPVVVHVVYSNSQQNISDQQINSQIDVLNADFRATNSDASSAPAEFADLVADSEVSFTLAAVNRHSNSRTEWGTRDEVKAVYPPVSPETTLNIWVANIGGGILGYAQFPGGPAATDGVVISPQYFGNTGYVAAPYDQGRTATHEVGHYLNLRHIWGDGRCRQDDFVADTPESDGPNYGCPSYPTVNCRSTDMTMNYMDYVYDECMYMFSEGQKARMRTIFMDGGPRAALAN
ncbi:zinc metalloprotease [Gramella sp. MT6]|uniref:M43 family zinc metalloprotease n=1 Tax=Gramella sp. MT6 TaxID=2705471 RepID=UPI001C60207D|nr:M43 family zinc metalloprotease [Gramella sp. MT6]QYA26824.1 zinc metalloprotease [Gramella sp. MT6]